MTRDRDRRLGWDDSDDLPPPPRRVSPGKVSGVVRAYGAEPVPMPIMRKPEIGGASELGELGNSFQTGVNQTLAKAAQSSGETLPKDLRMSMASSLGADLGAVRVHTGPESAAAAKAVGAKAFATGHDIHFAPGQYDPASAIGQHLLAHEVAHTVQQQSGGGTAPQGKLEVSRAGDAAEVEADRFADMLVAGGTAKVATRAPMQIAREESLGNAAMRSYTLSAIKHRQAPADMDPRMAQLTYAPQLPPPDDAAPLRELITYARQMAVFQKEWNQLRLAAETEIFDRYQRGLNGQELSFLRMKAKERFYELEKYLVYAAAEKAAQYAARELEKQLRDAEAIAQGRTVAHGDPGDPSFIGELGAQAKRSFDPRPLLLAMKENVKKIVARSDEIRREAAARGDYAGASFAALSALAEATIEDAGSAIKALNDTIRLVKGDRDEAAKKGAAQLLLIGVGAAIGRVSPLRVRPKGRRQGGSGTRRRGPGLQPAHAGADADGFAPVSGAAGAAPLSHESIVGLLVHQSQRLKKVSEKPGGPGGWNKKLNSPKPNKKYVMSGTGYVYQTDGKSRVVRVVASLRSGKGHRNDHQQRVAGRESRLDTDQGGHLLARIFKGPGEGLNLVPMDSKLNQGPWRDLERTWSTALSKRPRPEVKVRITVNYKGNGTRPTSFDVWYKIGSAKGKPVRLVNPR